jgi:hypothetical protein
MFIAFIFISIATTTISNLCSIYMNGNSAPAQIVGYGLALQVYVSCCYFISLEKIIQYFGLRKTPVITLLVTALRM